MHISDFTRFFSRLRTSRPGVRALAAACLALGLGMSGAARVAGAAECAGAGISATAVSAMKSALRNGNGMEAWLARLKDPAERKAVRWYYLRHRMKHASHRDLLNFAVENPRWPRAGTMRAVGELKLLLNGSEADLAAWFAAHKPASAAGRVAQARHLLSIGERKKAREVMKAAWRDPNLPEAAEKYVRRYLHKDLLTRTDDAARLWRLIIAQKTRKAVHFSRYMPAGYRKAAAAARALMRRQRGAVAQYRRLPASMRGKQALRYALARYYRRTKQPLKALAVLRNVPTDHAKLIMPEQWWTERRLVARHLLQKRYRGHWKTAYHLATRHGFSLKRKNKHAFRGEFLAGFIAFEKLGLPKRAMRHFERLPKLATSRTLKSKGWYWIGRAREKLGDVAGARRAYAEAAKTPSVYYGLLAREKLGKGREPIPLKMAWPTAQAKCKVRGHELGKAARLVRAAGRKEELFSFVWPLAYSFRDRTELAAAASLLWDLGGPTLAVRLAKAAGIRGHDIDNYGYPTRALPAHRSRENVLELPVVLALTRQESEFNPNARSFAGARGLMQLMPGTARREARHLRVRYNPRWLTARPAYNLMLGRHHLARIMANFNGSYIMAFAAYNAGGGNVRNWLKDYGNPLAGEMDPVEWVELIPFTETRKYVQKVLQGTHVYRTRLKRPMHPISKDLWRGIEGWRELVLRGGAQKSGAARPAQTGSITPASAPADTASGKASGNSSGKSSAKSSGKGAGNCSGKGASSVGELIGKC